MDVALKSGLGVVRDHWKWRQFYNYATHHAASLRQLSFVSTHGVFDVYVSVIDKNGELNYFC